VFTLVPARQLQIIQRRLLRFLDKAMQQNHPLFRINVEQYPRDAVLGEMRPYFADAATEGSAHWHTDRPSKFDCLDILTDELAVLGRWQAFQPFPKAVLRPLQCGRRSPGLAYRAFPPLEALRVRPPAPFSALLPPTYEVYHLRYKHTYPPDWAWNQPPEYSRCIPFAAAVAVFRRRSV